MNDTERHIIESYSTLLDGLSINGKKELIENLSKSLNTKTETKTTEFYKFLVPLVQRNLQKKL